jgi:hypothetical protein
MKAKVYEMVNKMTWKIMGYSKIEGKRKCIISGKFHGTVFSGHPTRTTLGNSLRVILYIKFIMANAGITNYRLYVGGDDVFIILNKCDLARFQKEFWMNYSPK